MNNREKFDEFQAWQDGRIRRRDFLLGGVKVSLSFLALDALALPGFAQQTGVAKPGSRTLDQFSLTKPPTGLDDSLNMMAAYLVQYSPPTRNLPASGAWKATYDLIEWFGSPRTPKDGVSGGADITYGLFPQPKPEYFRRNRLIGNLAVTRRPEAVESGVSYDLSYTNELFGAPPSRSLGFESSLRSTMTCSGDRLPRLLEWKTDYEKHRIRGPRSSATLSERGQHKDGVLEVASKAGTRRFKTDRPVAPQWAVWDALRGVRADSPNSIIGVEFDLLHDLTSYRPRQRLKPCGVLDISLDGRSYTLHGFVQTGIGTAPTHYWIDTGGRPLLVTGGILSSALTSIEEA